MDVRSPPHPVRRRGPMRGAHKYAAQRAAVFVLFAAVAFPCAGRLDWPRAWANLAVTAVVAGLGVRFGRAHLPAWLFVAGALVTGAAEAFGTWAEVVNTDFEQFVRIQADRGHRVVSTGPHGIVRHPG